jgi:hypothetical protein
MEKSVLLRKDPHFGTKRNAHMEVSRPFAEALSYYSAFFNKEEDLDMKKKPVMVHTALVLYMKGWITRGR